MGDVRVVVQTVVDKLELNRKFVALIRLSAIKTLNVVFSVETFQG